MCTAHLDISCHDDTFEDRPLMFFPLVLHAVAGAVFMETLARLKQKHEQEQKKRQQAKMKAAGTSKRKRQEQAAAMDHAAQQKEDEGQEQQQQKESRKHKQVQQQAQQQPTGQQQQPITAAEGPRRSTSPQQLAAAAAGQSKSQVDDQNPFQPLIPGLADGCVSAAVGWLSQELVGHPFMYIKGHHLYLQAAHMKEKVMEWAAAEAKVDHHKEEEQGRGGQ